MVSDGTLGRTCGLGVMCSRVAVDVDVDVDVDTRTHRIAAAAAGATKDAVRFSSTKKTKGPALLVLDQLSGEAKNPETSADASARRTKRQET
jgi:hypothetical protein